MSGSNVARDLCSGEETLVPGALRGFRSWDLEIYSNPLLKRVDSAKHDFTGLFSVSVSIPWVQPMVAGCYRTSGCPCMFCTNLRRDKKPPHDPTEPVPVAGCECGLYGWYTPKWIEADNWWPKAGAVGVIEASGRVLMGSKGFRCERAKIVAVAPACLPAALEASYGVHGFLAAFDKVRTRLTSLGVHVVDDVDALFDAYPPEDISSLVTVEGSDEHAA